MFCSNCGDNLNPGVSVCPRCGRPVAAVGAIPLSPNDERMWGMLAHLLGLFAGFLGPLIIFLVKGNESPYVRDQSAEALNWHISVFIYMMVSVVLMFVIIGFVTAAAVGICNLIFSIMGAMQANNGQYYRYPMCIRFIS